MCCVFTCCGWMIDLLQRLWTFTMSCCISSAVCCMLMTSSMSGIAMGYNYSLAEYIDLKETNVSVYLKRGVFDDEVTSDMEFRRSGHLPVAGHIRDTNLVTGDDQEEESMPLRSGRRLDDSVFQSDDHNNFEGSLMKLTAKPPAATPSTEAVTSDEKIGEIIQKYPSDSIDQLKAIHGLINMRRANDNRQTKNYDKMTTANQNVMVLPGGRRMMIDPDSPDKHNMYVGGRAIPFEQPGFKLNPARLAVPDNSMPEAPNWFLPKVTPERYKNLLSNDYDNIPCTAHTYPRPIRYRTDPQRPTRVKVVETSTMSQMEKIKEEEPETRRLENSELNRIQNNLLMDKANFPRFRKPEYEKPQSDDLSSNDVDYEEEANKGLPVLKRQKRNFKGSDDISFKRGLNHSKIKPTLILTILKKRKNENITDVVDENIIQLKSNEPIVLNTTFDNLNNNISYISDLKISNPGLNTSTRKFKLNDNNNTALFFKSNEPIVLNTTFDNLKKNFSSISDFKILNAGLNTSTRKFNLNDKNNTALFLEFAGPLSRSV